MTSVSVSVVIAAFNVQDYIARAIESVRVQTVADWEILVVDDASQDRTADLVREFARIDSRIKLIRQWPNEGPSAARNRAIEAAQGEWIAILDADDAWRPERLQHLLKVADETGVEIVADDLIVFDEGLGSEIGVYYGFDEAITRIDIEAFFRQENPLRLSMIKPIVSRRFLLDTGLRYDKSLRSAEDFLLYAELLFAGARAALVRDALYVYTMRVGPVSRKWAAGSRSNTSVADLFRIADTLVARYGDRITPAVADGIARFRRRAEGRRTSSEITRLRQSRSFGRLLLFLLANPRGAVSYLRSSRSWKRRFDSRFAN